METIRLLELPSTHIFPEHSCDPRCQAIAHTLQVGDFIVVKQDGPGRRPLVRRIIEWAQRVRSSWLSVGPHQMQRRHSKAVHVGVVTKVDPGNGVVRVSEAVSAGLRDINILTLADHGLAQVWEVYRAQPDDGMPPTLVERIRLLASERVRDGTVVPQHERDGQDLRQRFAHTYSRIKALRSVLMRAWGKRATARRIVRQQVRSYCAFKPEKELPWNRGKVRSTTCSQLIGSRGQFAEFEAIVELMEEEDDVFAAAIGRARAQHFENRIVWLQYIEGFLADWAEQIYDRLVYFRLNARFASPMELAEHFETHPLFERVALIKPGSSELHPVL